LYCIYWLLVIVAAVATLKVDENKTSIYQSGSQNVTQYGVPTEEENSSESIFMKSRWGMRDDDDDDDDNDNDDDEREDRHSRRSSRRDDYDDDDDDDDDDNRRRGRGRRNRNDDDDDGRTPEFKHCGGNSIRLHVHKFPNPLLLREGEKLNMAFTAVVTETLPEPIYARISIRKKVLGLWNRIPCVGRVGSCEYEVTCDKIRKQYGGRMNQPCPPPVGKTQREFTFTMPKIPRIVRNFASGTYKIQAKLFTKKKKRGELLACSETQVRVQT